jgi:cellulose synthase/poly-beta-1,6-N-acetylglucosamine synthase-like glycosyltransferase
MATTAKIVFWVSLALLFYVYAGYPLLLLLWRRLAARPVRRAAIEPSVTVIIAAHNERRVIEEKIANCLGLDYPRDRLQIVVALDAPTDGTEEVVWKYAGRTVDSVYYAPHRGKAGALNRALAVADGEILVLADARQRFDRSAVRELVANFDDPSVGAVSGELVLLDEAGREAGGGVGLYWRYEKRLRALESDIHSTLGVTGAIYAIRRSLFRPIPEETILDDVAIPMAAVLAGKRVLFEPKARAFDRVSATPEIEYGRKVRTLMGNYQLLAMMPALLSPRSNPVFWQFWSHKMGRLLAPHLLIALLVSNLFLRHGVYLWAMAAQSAWYGLALLGWAATRRAESRRVQRIPSARMPGRFDAAGDTAVVNDAEEKAA